MAGNQDVTQAGPLFRTSKRQRVFRRREESPDANTQGQVVSDTITESTNPHHPVISNTFNDTSPQRDTPDDDSTPRLNALLRQRKATVRRAGIAFSNTAQRTQEDQSLSASLTMTEEKPDVLEQASQRFTMQTGEVADVHDKHM